MPPALRGIRKDILFRVGPRLTEPGLRWAPATMLLRNDNNGLIQTTGEVDDQGFLTAGDGLLVRLAGFRLSLLPCPKGLPSNSRTIMQSVNQNTLWMRDEHGSWYLLRRRFPIEEGSFLTDRTLCATIADGNNIWIINSKSKFQTLMSLLAEEENRNIGIKKAQSKLHVTSALSAQATQDWLNGEYGLAQQLADSTAARYSTTFEDGDVDMDLTAYEAACYALTSEVHGVATSDDAKKITGAAEYIAGQDGSTLIKEYIQMIFMGQYLCAKDKAPATQQWCVD